MRNIAVRLQYDGTAYHGWQVQKTEVTVAETLEKALSKVCKHPVKVVGCGRTDAGVHALRYCANFRTDCAIPADRVPLAVNARLPGDISVTDAVEAPGYHPITYEYDNKDRVTATIQEARKVTMEYDQLDRVRCETDALGTKTVYEYNVAGNVSRITELPKGVKASDARVSEFVYDANGNLTETKAADGTSTKSVYDKDNRRIEETDANGNTTTYGFDKAGNVVRIDRKSVV